VIALLIAGGWVAWRNVRLGRGDRRGASRLAQVMAVMAFATWLASTHYFPEFVPFTWNLLNVGLAYSVTTAAFAAYVYLALEPYVRRRMPELLIGWARLLEGRWRDARVARELLIGTACGASLALLVHVAAGLPAWIPVAGKRQSRPRRTSSPADEGWWRRCSARKAVACSMGFCSWGCSFSCACCYETTRRP
jgi:hypothetical protein